jgi:hypothetical protein
MDSTLRPLSTSQVLDRTFHLYRNNFWLFAGIAALPPAVVLIAQAGFFLMAYLSATKVNAIATGVAVVMGVVAVVVLYLLAHSFATGATVYAVSRVHLGYAVRIGESYRNIRPVVWRITGIFLLVSIISAVAILLAVAASFLPSGLLYVVGSQSSRAVSIIVSILTIIVVAIAAILVIRLYCSYQLAVPACVLENLPVVAGLRRSRFLSKGKCIQRILLVLVLALVLGWVLSIALTIPVLLLTIFAVQKSPLFAIPIALWQYVAGFIAGTLAGPIATIAISLLYYDERVRKEAFDLQLMMQAVGEAPPQQMAASANPPAIG